MSKKVWSIGNQDRVDPSYPTGEVARGVGVRAAADAVKGGGVGWWGGNVGWAGCCIGGGGIPDGRPGGVGGGVPDGRPGGVGGGGVPDGRPGGVGGGHWPTAEARRAAASFKVWRLGVLGATP
jgi:hypothetical protein